MQPGEKVFQGDKEDTHELKPKSTPSSALEEGTTNLKNGGEVSGGGETEEQSLLQMGDDDRRKKVGQFCSPFCISRSLGIWCLALTMVIIGYILWYVSPLLGVIVGVIAPPALWMIFFSEAIGGTSMDRRQVAIVVVTCWGLLVIWLLLNGIITLIAVKSGFYQAQMAFTKNAENACCQFVPDNMTVYRPEYLSWDVKNACVCPITGLNLLIQSALPEEILKYFAISFFTYRSYVADPDAVMSLGIASGGAFALFENILYANKQGQNALIVRFLLPMPMHIISQLIMGAYLAKKKFVYKEMGKRFDCYCSGKIPAYMILAIGILIHSIHNFTLGAFGRSVSIYWRQVFPWTIVILNLIGWHLFARMKYTELDAVPRVNIRKLQMLRWLPRGFCCYCHSLADNDYRRERRMESIYEMSEKAKEFELGTGKEGNNTQQYAPPSGVQMKLTLPVGVQPGAKVKYPLSNGKEILYTVQDGQKGGDVVDIVV